MGRYVVVGAGQVGSAVSLVLAERGDDVSLISRSASGPDHPRIARVRADATDADALGRLAAGAAAVVNAANPAYHRWAVDWPPLADALLAAAQTSGAVLVTVSNLYGYGPVDGPMTEDLPLAATGVKGRVRADMWRQALAAHEAGRVRVTEVRGSDYVCPGVQSQLGDRVMKPLMAGKAVQVLKSLDQPHTWTSVKDVATLVATIADDERAWGRAWHVPSGPPRTQREAVADLAAAAGVSVKVGELPGIALRLGGLFVPLLRELPEVAYQRLRPFVLDSTAAQTTFGLAPTPWQDVIDAQVAAYRS